jgi:serine O-acetyltransferase
VADDVADDRDDTRAEGAVDDAPSPDGGTEGGSLEGVVDALCAAPHPSPGDGRQRYRLPSRAQLAEVVHTLRSVLFPGYLSPWDLAGEALRHYVGAGLDRVAHDLQEQVRRVLLLEEGCGEDEAAARAGETTRRFLARLPEVRDLLLTDVRAAFEGDPAARSHDEIILAYPGLVAITCQRLAHQLHRLDVPLLPRIITEEAHGRTGIDIHPGARIGRSFFIDHGTGVVIGETCVIGDRVRIYQGVTLGAKSFPLDARGRPVKGVDRHPIVEDDVVIYSGATVLGRITIGRGSVIGGNVWVTRSVPPGSSVTQGKARESRYEEGGGI